MMGRMERRVYFILFTVWLLNRRCSVHETTRKRPRGSEGVDQCTCEFIHSFCLLFSVFLVFPLLESSTEY